MIKVVFISDGEDFILGNFEIHFVPMSKLMTLNNFYTADSLNDLYKNNDKTYFEFLNWFYKSFKDFDVLVCAQINPLHPEWLAENFIKTIKIYGMQDDPVCTYHRTLSELWAFDGVYYVSPSFNQKYTTKEFIDLYNSKIKSYFLPNATSNIYSPDHDFSVQNSFSNRKKSIIYVGQYYESKIDRLIYFKDILKDEFDVFGWWPRFGYQGVVRALKFKRPFLNRVTSLTENQKFQHFLNYKICLNMNWNEKLETGNLRMFQAPFYGMMLLNDIAAKDQHLEIFSNDEAVYFEGIEDATDKAQFYLKNDSERIRIAKNGYKKAVKFYSRNDAWSGFLNWAMDLKKLN